ISEPKNIKELRGRSASPGHLTGRVVIISYKNPENHTFKLQNMKKGDIIVTEMTRPSIITACEKAGAIITDEGGILCHAAIVARELNIPCVVGTENGTNVLKDGDLVEVNADEGTIKILKKF
ncbi:phosphoenolpyruvate synthase, partial [Candidatus Pacearchaeota archaeon]|nr:phosphoenolpyruvate synthase [Candidatus Pacearchaeota archaeon]